MVSWWNWWSRAPVTDRSLMLHGPGVVYGTGPVVIVTMMIRAID
ncbi:hypothetical protein KEM60_00742 [Austwickia sp. TVS 96-490-7B]|nr:hypothetical protein [Austwickia sp. TVS 96-490-7B]